MSSVPCLPPVSKTQQLYPEAEACFSLDVHGTGHAGVARTDATPVCAGCTPSPTITLSMDIKGTRPCLLLPQALTKGWALSFRCQALGQWFLLPHAGLAQSRIEY